MKKAAVVLCATSLSMFVNMANAGDSDAAVQETGMIENVRSFVSAKFYLNFDSKYMSYGLVDNHDPILTPGAWLTFFDVFSIGCEAIFDITHYGAKAGYTDRKWKHSEIYPGATVAYDFSPEQFEWLPTTFSLSLDYIYEYQANSKFKGEYPWNPALGEDTQYWVVSASLPDLWLVPTFTYERDVMRDKGTYLNLELAHTFSIIDEVLTLTPSVAQGWGDQRRVSAYLGECSEDVFGNVTGSDKPTLMDSCLKLTADWAICEYLTLSGYVAYYDYLFARGGVRDDVRRYEATGRDELTRNVVCGLSITASF